MPCWGVISRKDEITRRSASSKIRFGAFGNSSTISDMVSSSLLGTAVLKLNSMIRSEKRLLTLVTSADVRCLRSTIRKSDEGESIGGRFSDAYNAGRCISATILIAGSFKDLV